MDKFGSCEGNKLLTLMSLDSDTHHSRIMNGKLCFIPVIYIHYLHKAVFLENSTALRCTYGLPMRKINKTVIYVNTC